MTGNSAPSSHPISNDDGSRPRKNYSDCSASALIKNDGSDTGRGLEILIFQGRQLKRYIAMRTIMEYNCRNKRNIAIATKYTNPNIRRWTEAASLKLADVSTKCSQWARDVALMTGYLDFKCAYGNNEAILPKSSIERLCE